MLWVWLVSSWTPLVLSTMFPFFEFSNMSRAHFIMVYITPLGLLSSFMLIQMRTGQAIQLINALSQVSVSCWVLLLSCGVARSRSVVSCSSIEAEYRAFADITCELVWLRWLLANMDAPQPISTPIYYDNRSAIYIAPNDNFHECTKCGHKGWSHYLVIWSRNHEYSILSRKDI